MTHLEDKDLNTEYILIIFDELKEKAVETGEDFGSLKLDDIPAGIKDRRLEFYSLLKTNNFYDAVVIYNVIRDLPLWFERITLLAKLGHYREALELTITELRSITYACDCCVKFGQKPNQKEDPWKILLELLFKEEDGEYFS